jgi:hypothetical protein
MRRELLDEILKNGEGQTVEFKTSFAEQNAAIETMVAFANAQGGRVLFGVRNDGTVAGVEVGENTLENLARAVRDHSYPSLPVFIEEPSDYDGKKVVIAEVPPDIPPIVGVYLYASDAVPLGRTVEASELRTYRRAGRVTQKENFMRLRQPLPSDPRVRVALLRGRRYRITRSNSVQLSGSVWVEEGSATAHDVRFRFQPPIAECDSVYDDLPYPYESQHATPSLGFKVYDDFKFRPSDIPDVLPYSVEMSATYKDDWGLTWESSRRLDLLSEPSHDDMVRLVDAGQFSRRIVAFPPKG